MTSAEEIVACAKVQTVEFHGWGSRAGAVETPDRLVIDFDPDPKLGFELVKEAAFQVRRSFDAVGLESFALLSGGKGIHIVVPLEPVAEWDQVREFAKSFCTALAEAAPDKFTVALPKPQRRGRIFLDFLRNQRTATAIQPYSARARPECRSRHRSTGRSFRTSTARTPLPSPMSSSSCNARKAKS